MPGQKTAPMMTVQITEGVAGEYLHGMEIYHPSSGQLKRRYGSAVVQKLKQILAIGHQ